MRLWLATALLIFARVAVASNGDNLRAFFLHLSALEFEKAREEANSGIDGALRGEMLCLIDLLYFEGQTQRTPDIHNVVDTRANDKLLSFMRTLNAGYKSLYYDQVKGEAFKNFYQAYQKAKDIGDPALIKPCLLAFLKYYDLEIAQNSNSYRPYLQHLELLLQDPVDRFWLDIYKVIFTSKEIERLDESYFKLADALDVYETQLDSTSHLLAHLFYEKGLKFDLLGDLEQARHYYTKAINKAKGLPFLRPQRFFASLKQMRLEVRSKNFPLARAYLKMAKREAHPKDTLRSNYHLNLYSAVFFRAQGKNDSAYVYLMRAYIEDFRLDFRRNALEINRLNVELETQEQVNANLRLRQNKIWLTGALIGVGLLFLLSYLAYNNQRSRNKIERQEKDVQAMKLEKVLKDQELVGINSMIAGQEKERRRIANDLHDNLGSLLATLRLHFQTFRQRRTTVDPNDDSLLNKADELIKEAYENVRTMAHAKNVGVSAQEGLLPAVKQFASKVSVLNKLAIEVKEHGMLERLENTMEITIFSIIQELIANVIKHAQATEATIHLTQYEEAINLMVEDNGIGFDNSLVKSRSGMGLYSIQKRIESLGGTATIDSIPQRGTTIIIDIPLV